MTAAPKFRIDVTINDLLTSADQRPPAPAEAKGLAPESSVPAVSGAHFGVWS